MKESPIRYTNPFLSDEENEKVNLWTKELEHKNIEDDLTHNCEVDKLIKSLASSELCEKETELYTDKNVMECELPESLVSSKDGGFHVKDICVDEGIPHGEKILFDENNNLKPELLTFSTVEDNYMEPKLVSENNGKNDDHIVTEVNRDERKSDGSSGTHEVDADSPVNEPINDQDLQKSIQDSKEEVIDSIGPIEVKDVSKDDNCNGDGLSGSDTVSKAVDHNVSGIPLQHDEEQIDSSEIPSSQQDRTLPTLKSLLESIDQQPFQVKSEPATSSGVDELPIETHGAPKLQDAGSHNVPQINHGGEGESSFSVAGPMSGLVTYSGHTIGSTSLRSDSSTTSTRSFAFPILQNEWNSSPVRMAKAGRRQLPKPRGWRHGLLCCRF